MKDRVLCSDEKLCGCVHIPKKRKDKETIITGEPVINQSMKNCARFIPGASATRYCCLTRKMVHIMK